jgi:hypothetical protein
MLAGTYGVTGGVLCHWTRLTDERLLIGSEADFHDVSLDIGHGSCQSV